uniref:M96 mating-specific protein family n=1 Tax=Peronospora matthiolae TaxID=2874970 RepID=A0AAV1UGU4_9STRA
MALLDDSDEFSAALCFIDDLLIESADDEVMRAVAPVDHQMPSGAPRASLTPMTGRGATLVFQARKKRKREEKNSQQPRTRKTQSSSRNRARDQEQRELLLLREQVVDLQQKLEALLEIRGPAVVAPGDVLASISAREKTEKEDKVAVVWKEMAGHQLKQRLKSERENRQLKVAIEGQIKVVKSLEKTLQTKATTNAIESCLGADPILKRMHISTPDRSDAGVFVDLMAGVDEAYKEVDAVLRDNGLDTKESSFSDAEMHRGADGFYIQIFASKVLPFDVVSTGTAAWRYFSRSMEHVSPRFLDHMDHQDTKAKDDTIVESFGMELQAKGTQANYNVKQIVRRYVEDDRVVVVWRSYIDPVSFAGKSVCGAEFQEKGYLIVRQPRTSSSQFALLQTCYFISPALPMRSLPNECSITGELTDFVLSGTEANIASCHQTIENILFNETVKTRK